MGPRTECHVATCAVGPGISRNSSMPGVLAYPGSNFGPYNFTSVLLFRLLCGAGFWCFPFTYCVYSATVALKAELPHGLVNTKFHVFTGFWVHILLPRCR